MSTCRRVQQGVSGARGGRAGIAARKLSGRGDDERLRSDAGAGTGVSAVRKDVVGLLGVAYRSVPRRLR